MGDRGPLLSFCRGVTLQMFLKKDKQREQPRTEVGNAQFQCSLNTYSTPETLNRLIYSYKNRKYAPFTKETTESQLAKIMSKFTYYTVVLSNSILIISITKANTKGYVS